MDKNEKQEKPADVAGEPSQAAPGTKVPLIIELSPELLTQVIGGFGGPSFIPGRCPAHGPVD